MINSTSSNEPKIAVTIANTTFVLGAAFSIFGICFSLFRIVENTWAFQEIPIFFDLAILIGVGSTILFGFALRLRNEQKIRLSLVIISVSIPVFSFETYQQLSIKTPYEFLLNLREQDSNVYINSVPAHLLKTNGLTTTNEQIFPLGGISDITTFFPNENGYYPVFTTDEHGFNNQDITYQTGTIDILLIGDSYAAGVAVHPSQNISGVLKSLGFSTASIGKSGNGPLLELAALKEYGEPLRPRVVIWLYYVNDLIGLDSEMKSPLLMKYQSDDEFSQNLIERQDEIDNALKMFLLEQEEEYEETNKRKPNSIIKILELDNLRRMISLTNKPPPALLSPLLESQSVFKTILKKSKQLAASWDGDLYFVYLPSFFYDVDNVEMSLRNFVLQTIADLGIPIVDIQNLIFSPHSDSLSLFPFRRPAHYNAKGYRLVAEAIAEKLTVDGVLQ